MSALFYKKRERGWSWGCKQRCQIDDILFPAWRSTADCKSCSVAFVYLDVVWRLLCPARLHTVEAYISIHQAFTERATESMRC